MHIHCLTRVDLSLSLSLSIHPISTKKIPVSTRTPKLIAFMKKIVPIRGKIPCLPDSSHSYAFSLFSPPFLYC